jgi:hypothetical protein
MKIFQRYAEILDDCFPNPPKNVTELTMKIMSKYPFDVVTNKHSIYDNGLGKTKKVISSFCMVVKISDGFYGISNMVVDPQYQGCQEGTNIMEKIHNRYEGIFILKTSKAKGFYEKLGYIPVYEDDIHTIMVFVNDKSKIDY